MRAVVRALLYAFFYLIFWPFFFTKKFGNKDYKIDGKTIIIANHFSDFDPFFIYKLYGFKNKIVFVADNRVKKNIFTRIFCWAFNCVYVNEGAEQNFATVKKCIDVINQGKVLMIFPEGVINPSKQCFFDFSKSFCFLARKTGAKVLPLFIDPNMGLFTKTYIYIGDVFTSEQIASYKDDLIASINVQAKVFDYFGYVSEYKENKKSKKKE